MNEPTRLQRTEFSEQAHRGKPCISVVIPAHNEEDFLPQTLKALQAQDYPHYEVIVVANGCKDRTVEVAAPLCDVVYDQPARGLGPARNLGGNEAKGDLLVFLDADTLLEPNALSIIAQQFTRKHAMGTLKGVPDSKNASYKTIYLLKNSIHQAHLHHGSSGVIICWKDHFQKAGGFDTQLFLRENSDLMKKLRRFGKYKYISETPAVTSMRRYDETGTSEMIWLWLKVWFKSNFSDIRNQTYEAVTRKPEDRPLAVIRRGLSKKEKSLQTRDVPA